VKRFAAAHNGDYVSVGEAVTVFEDGCDAERATVRRRGQRGPGASAPAMIDISWTPPHADATAYTEPVLYDIDVSPAEGDTPHQFQVLVASGQPRQQQTASAVLARALVCQTFWPHLVINITGSGVRSSIVR
jgi:hypothetical protein